MTGIFSIARVAATEQIRNRLYLIILFFGVSIILVSTLLGTLAPGHRVRVIFDLGLVAIELFGLATAVFGAVSLVIQEIETKTIYLILTRPIGRPSYILGRFLGLVIAVAITMVIMAVIHVGVIIYKPQEFQLFLDTVNFWSFYPVLIIMSLAKMLVTTALALFFSLFATSSVSALIFTGAFWVAGHFGTELSFLLQKTFTGVWYGVARAASIVLPNYQYFNLRDTFSFPGGHGLATVSWAWVYALAYVGFCLLLSSILFSRKEF